MKITIQNARTLDSKALILIWLGDKQVVMSKDEFNILKEEIKLFETGEKTEGGIRIEQS